MITNNCFYIKTSVLEIYVGFQGMRNKEKNLIADPPNVRSPFQAGSNFMD